jgi:hydrogenase maturation protease
MRGDDSAGLQIVRMWQENHPQTAKEVKVEFSENPGLELLELLEGAEAVVIVDAVHSSASPGTLIRVETDDLLSFTSISKLTHGWGVAETIKLGSAIYPWMASVCMIMIGVVASKFKQGTAVCPQVSSAYPAAVEKLETEVCKLLAKSRSQKEKS